MLLVSSFSQFLLIFFENIFFCHLKHFVGNKKDGNHLMQWMRQNRPTKIKYFSGVILAECGLVLLWRSIIFLLLTGVRCFLRKSSCSFHVSLKNLYMFTKYQVQKQKSRNLETLCWIALHSCWGLQYEDFKVFGESIWEQCRWIKKKRYGSSEVLFWSF